MKKDFALMGDENNALELLMPWKRRDIFFHPCAQQRLAFELQAVREGDGWRDDRSLGQGWKFYGECRPWT
jgi:hypothetical protein